jgi:ADP-ribose pyrophosphatase YjhB (NUDIX family)
MSKRKFCGNCGTAYTNLDWPRICDNCGDIAWKNPIPVSVAIQPVWAADFGRKGLVIAQRANEPCIGGWSLVGGYVDMEDANFIEAAAREFAEETYLEAGLPGKIVFSGSNDHGNMLVGVLMQNAITYETFQTAVPCHENLALGVMWTPSQVKLCFPLHQQIAENWFKGEYDK